MIKTNFFDGNEYFIDEKVNFFKFENVYKVYNESGDSIGSVSQELGFGQKMLQLLISKKVMPFKLNIIDSNTVIQATITRRWTFWLSKIEVRDSNDILIAYIKQKFSLFKPTFIITDANDNTIAIISGDWKAWEFRIDSKVGERIGYISKKWNGVIKEFFTDADKYKVFIGHEIKDQNQKAAILSAAITIDMVLKEKK